MKMHRSDYDSNCFTLLSPLLVTSKTGSRLVHSSVYKNKTKQNVAVVFVT